MSVTCGVKTKKCGDKFKKKYTYALTHSNSNEIIESRAKQMNSNSFDY